MVSSTRCLVWSDQVMKCSEARAATPMDQCPVERSGEFPDVIQGNERGFEG